LRGVKGGPFAVTYWDGETEVYGTEEQVRDQVNGESKRQVSVQSQSTPRFRLILREKISLQDVLANPSVELGEAYIQGKIEIEGDLREFFRIAIQNQSRLAAAEVRGLAQRFLRRQRSTSKEEQAEGVRQHYDLGNDFFRLWLDETMSYSCAYFRRPTDSLRDAQLQKIHHTLRKLNLRPGERLLDIGSGWGGLIIRAAKKYGVQAVGITLSKNQVEETKRRIKAEGLTGQVEVRLADYRNLAEESEVFDKIVSVGMFEHVGKENIPVYMEAVNKMLKPGGLSVLHTITHCKETPPNPWMEKYIFPWGYIPSLREIVWQLPEFDFHLLDVESLRLHYALTLDHWAENFERVVPEVKKMYGEAFVKMWRLYLVGCAVSFRYSGLDIHQLLFSKGLNNDLPMTREGWYAYKE